MKTQRYAIKDKHGWIVLNAPLPCMAGEGVIVERGCSMRRVRKLIKQFNARTVEMEKIVQ